MSTLPVPARGLRRVAYLLLAYASLGLAILGVFLPGLPSTEFVLLAAWAAARSSPRLMERAGATGAAKAMEKPRPKPKVQPA